jgi:hypothetical protein
MPVKTYKYFFYDEEESVIYYADELPDPMNQFVYLGTSDNPKPGVAAGHFMRQHQSEAGKSLTGFRLREYEV